MRTIIRKLIRTLTSQLVRKFAKRKYFILGCLAISLFILIYSMHGTGTDVVQSVAMQSTGTQSVEMQSTPMASPQATSMQSGPTASPKTAEAVKATPLPISITMINSQGEKIGTAQLTQLKGKVQIHLDLSDLPPGTHGFHIHNAGLCEVPDFKTAGAHFNPFDKQHGINNPLGFHAGDLPNFTVKADGKVNAIITSSMVTLEPGMANSLLTPGGTSLVIHEKADDYKTDPSGNSGSRIACGVIQPPANQ